MKVTFHATVREAAGISMAEIDAVNLRELVSSLRERFGERLFHMILRDDELRDDVIILVNGRNISQLEGLETRLDSNDQIAIFPPISGG